MGETPIRCIVFEGQVWLSQADVAKMILGWKGDVPHEIARSILSIHIPMKEENRGSPDPI